jgi:hypothetical protein
VGCCTTPQEKSQDKTTNLDRRTKLFFKIQKNNFKIIVIVIFLIRIITIYLCDNSDF